MQLSSLFSNFHRLRGIAGRHERLHLDVQLGKRFLVVAEFPVRPCQVALMTHQYLDGVNRHLALPASGSEKLPEGMWMIDVYSPLGVVVSHREACFSERVFPCAIEHRCTPWEDSFVL